jgi:two-component system CheB/CheR fusion protein
LNTTAAMFPVVGIGASAGGLEALEAFFDGVPAQLGAGIVIVTHLNPERESILHKIIARYTNMPVHVATHGAAVGMDEVYVMPADATVTIEGGVLHMHRRHPGRPERKPIDIFLSSLAQDRGEHAVAVILSGGDGDGTLGIKAVKERGGLTLAQVADGTAPSNASMPNSAIATGMVDFALSAGGMGARIAQYAQSLENLNALADGFQAAGSEDWEAARQEICGILRTQVGHDFAGYKTKTFIRRVQRRMQMVQTDTVSAYLEFLRQDAKEANMLFRDLLINVTNFFRDAEAFESLNETVIPKLFEMRGADHTVRVWVPGCATGEEVFSIAILLREHMDKLCAAPRVQIFATDIDETALALARAARYPEALMDSVSAARKRRFFVQDGASFVLSKEVRDLCIFSPHSVIRDPPFSRIDLISCRNLLIYFGAEAQNQVIPIFHHALRPSGYLFLGTSENVSQFTNMFAPVDKKHRIFRSREDGPARAAVPLILRGLQRPTGVGELGRVRPPPAGVAFRLSVEAQVLDRFAPAHVVVNGDGDVVYFSAKTGRYLEPATGAPSRQLLAMVRKGLRFDLRAALRQAIESGSRAVREHLTMECDDGRLQQVTLTVERLAEQDRDQPLYLVVFNDEGASVTRAKGQSRAGHAEPDEMAHMQSELRETQDRLQGLIEEYETALEESKSSNEELVSVNEEMQSANEELEASKEELQSLNEELHTVNAELNIKVEALDRAHNDLENLFETSQVATVFLDQHLVIRSFTPAVAGLFNILPTDRGRPLTDLTSKLSMPSLAQDVRRVFETGLPIERRITLGGSRQHFLTKLLPYRSESGIDGVVATFIDVSEITQAESHQRVLIAELNHRVKNMLSVVLALAEQTMGSTETMEDFRDSFSARVQAMARSHELLSRESWTEGALEELVRLQLAPFGLDRVKAEGPKLQLKPKQALSAGMVLHELATNASKYGALSVPQGRVKLTWSVQEQEDGWFTIVEWREEGGPPAELPRHRGFGLRLVEKEAAYNLGGKAEFDFSPTGLAVRIGIKTLRGAER